MNYQETLDWMFSRLPMYQRQGNTAFKKDLTNSIAFADVLGNPQQVFKSIHVGGTNGKGSTSHMIASILQEAGYKVGLYTSPHLKSFTERIRINGETVSEEFVIDFIEKHQQFLTNQGLSFFEMTVGMAFQYFAQEKVDYAVIEVGLGGRLDSTNIIKPEVSVITNIGYDHMQFLGETLPEIAYEKAGIIKENTPVVIGEEQEEVSNVFIDKASSLQAPICFASQMTESYETDLLGSYQQKNSKTAVTAIQQLQSEAITDEMIRRGLQRVVLNTNLQGRWQLLNKEPLVICDTAHNKEGLTIVMSQLKTLSYKSLHIVLGMVNDKKLEDILPLLPSKATYYFCRPDIPRGLDAEQLQKIAANYNLQGNVFSSVSEAYQTAFDSASKDDVIYVGGSTFVVAEVL